MKHAETILYGGTIHTMDDKLAVCDAVAVLQGRVVATGADRVADWKGPQTELINLHGRPVLPGFQDAHIHPTAGGLARLRCDLSEIHSREGYVNRVAEYALSNQDSEWIRGAGWYGDVFEDGFPTKETLDAVVPDRPVVLTSHDGHGVWVNSVALTRAGIAEGTPDPPGGRIHRDAQGAPTGMLVESAAELVTDVLPQTSGADIEAAVLQAQDYLHSLGITAWQDAAVGDAIGIPDAFQIYRSLADAGQLTAKVTGALWWNREADFANQIEALTARRDAAARSGAVGGEFQATAVKIMQDGVCENLTGSMLEPYRGQGEERGCSFIDPAHLRQIVRALDAQRFDVHLHTVGDRAVREAIEAIAASDYLAWDNRHQITHIDFIERSDVALMARHGIIANLQPLWARRDPVLVSTKLPYLSDEQQARHFVFRSLRDAGIPLAFSSDWPVSSPNPLWGAHVAVNRTAPPGDPHAQDNESQTIPLLPDESIRVHDALVAYTRGAARANRLESRTGVISVGQEADLVILNHDPYETPKEEIGALTVNMTIASGSVVYRNRM